MPVLSPDETLPLGTQNVAICVPTFRRPRQLKLLLSSLAGLVSPELPAKIEVLVVDNDLHQSARSICEAAVLPWPLRYVVEPKRGIAQVRNAAVRNCSNADWIAFVDDDEIVEPQWLDQLTRTQRKFQADIVAGPALVEFESEVPKWFVQSGTLVRGRFPTGSKPRMLCTANVLIRTNVFRQIGPFDERFGLTGGEDSEFFIRASQAGLKIVWCDEAVTHETLGPARAGLRYLLRRSYQNASTATRAELICSPGIFTCGQRTAKAILRIAQGMLMLPVACLLGLPAIARALDRIFLGAGMLGGLMGINIEPYHNTESNL